MMEKLKERKYLLVINLFWFLVIFFLSYRMPYFSDDYGPLNSMVHQKPIDNLGRVLPSLIVYYNNWGGRCVSYVLIHSLLLLPKIVFDFLNAVIYVLTVNFAGRIVFSSNNLLLQREEREVQKEEIVILMLFLLMWFFMPGFSDVTTWLTGSISYLWMNCIVMACGLLYYRNFIYIRTNMELKKESFNVARIIGYIILGLLAGCSAEASACTLVFALLCYVLYCFRHGRRLPLHEQCGIVSVIVGFLALMLAPGNRERAAVVKRASESTNMIFTYIFRFGRETFYSLRFITIPLAIAITLFLLSHEYTKRKIKNFLGEIICGKELFFLMLSFVSIYVMTFSSGFAIRIFQFSLLMIFIATGISICKIYDMIVPRITEGVHYIERTVIGFFCVLSLFVLVEIATGILYTRQNGSFFNREMYYYYVNDTSTSGLMSGNGIEKVKGN